MTQPSRRFKPRTLSLSQKFRSLTFDEKKLANEVTDLASRNEDLSSQVVEMSRAIERGQTRINGVTCGARSHSLENVQLSDHVRKLSEVNVCLSSQNKVLSTQVGALSSTLEDILTQNSILSEQNEDTSAKSKVLVVQVGNLRAEKKGLVARAELLESQVERLWSQVGEMTALVKSLSSQNIKLSSKNADLALQLARLSSEKHTSAQANKLFVQVESLAEQIKKLSGIRASLECPRECCDELPSKAARTELSSEETELDADTEMFLALDTQCSELLESVVTTTEDYKMQCTASTQPSPAIIREDISSVRTEQSVGAKYAGTGEWLDLENMFTGLVSGLYEAGCMVP